MVQACGHADQLPQCPGAVVSWWRPSLLFFFASFRKRPRPSFKTVVSSVVVRRVFCEALWLVALLVLSASCCYPLGTMGVSDNFWDAVILQAFRFLPRRKPQSLRSLHQSQKTEYTRIWGPRVPLLCLLRIKSFEVWSWEPSSVVPCFSAFGMKTAMLPVWCGPGGSRCLDSSPPKESWPWPLTSLVQPGVDHFAFCQTV